MYNVQYESVLYENAAHLVICESWNLCGQHVHDHIMSLRWEVWVH